MLPERITINHSFKFINQKKLATIHVNQELRIVNLNQTFIELSKTRYNNLIGKRLNDEIDLNNLEWLKLLPFRSFLLDTNYQCEHYVESTHRWYEVRINRTVELYIITVTDITEARNEEVRLRESETRYRKLVEHSHETISLHNGEEFLYINPAGLDLFHLRDLNQIQGKSIWKYIQQEDHKMFYHNIRDLMLGLKKVTYSNLRVSPSNKEIIYVEATSTLTSFKGEVVIRTSFNDISEKLKLEDVIRKTDKLDVVSQLAAGVAHEIRNPLTTVKGFLQFIKNEQEFNENYIEIVLAELAKLEEIMYEYLTLANPNHETFMNKIDLDHLLKKVIKLTHTQAILKDIEYIVNIRKIPKVFGNEKQLKQVFINIIQNAIEAVENKGKIKIEVNHSEDNVIIKIMDNGCGMPKERIARLGEPYFSTKEKGTGIGLMVCMKMLSNHQGTIHFDSKEDEGTTVTITIPVPHF